LKPKLELNNVIKSISNESSIEKLNEYLDFIIENINNTKIKGVLLDNLLKSVIQISKNFIFYAILFEKSMKILELLIVNKTSELLMYLDIIVPNLLIHINSEIYTIQESSYNVLNIVRKYYDADQMLDSFIIASNNSNVDLKLNAIEVISVLLSQTDVWLQVDDNIKKLIDLYINLSVHVTSNEEFKEPIILGIT